MIMNRDSTMILSFVIFPIQSPDFFFLWGIGSSKVLIAFGDSRVFSVLGGAFS